MGGAAKSNSELIIERWADLISPQEYVGMTLIGHIIRIATLERELIEANGAPYGLSQMDTYLLLMIRGLKKSPIHQSDLSRLFSYTPGAITHRIGRLRRLGLVRTHKSKIDSRAVVVELTDAGHATIQAIGLKKAAEMAARLKSVQLSKSELDTFMSVLRRLEAATEAVIDQTRQGPDADLDPVSAPATVSVMCGPLRSPK